MDAAFFTIGGLVVTGVAMLCCIACWRASTNRRIRIKQPVARHIIMAQLVEFNLFLCVGVCVFVFIFIFMCYRCIQLTWLNPPQTVIQIAPTNNTEAESCYICMENHPDVMLLNCKHDGICTSCASDLMKTTKKCPLCREPIRRYIPQSSDIEMQPPRSPAPAYHPSESHPPPPES